MGANYHYILVTSKLKKGTEPANYREGHFIIGTINTYKLAGITWELKRPIPHACRAGGVIFFRQDMGVVHDIYTRTI
jgi:hypothetical protein